MKSSMAEWLKRAALFLSVMALLAASAVRPLQAQEAAYDDGGSSAPGDESVSQNDIRTEQDDEGAGDAEISRQDTANSGEQEQANSNNQKQPEKPRITSQPEDARVEAGDCAYFNVSAVGKKLTYQWLVDKGDGSGFQEVKGADQELYRVMVFDGSMNGYAYKCIVRSGYDSAGENSGKGNVDTGEEPTENYVESRAARLTIFYRIVSGARSVWVRSSGRGLVFQGSGSYSRFSGINVDGSRISAGEYNKGGSQTPFTEITLLRSYLETLSEGDHELEIVWEDGAAKTSFRIEPPAANLPADVSGLGRTGADTTGSSRAAGTTSAVGDAAEMAEKKEKGDPSSAGGNEEKPAQISGNTADASVSENTQKPSAGTAADVLGKTDILAGVPKQEMTVTPGTRRTQAHSGPEKSPVQLAAMSEALGRYARTICMAVILISAAGIAGGLCVYKLHDLEGRKR